MQTFSNTLYIIPSLLLVGNEPSLQSHYIIVLLIFIRMELPRLHSADKEVSRDHNVSSGIVQSTHSAHLYIHTYLQLVNL